MTSRTLATTLGLIALSFSLNAPAAIVTFVASMDGHQEINSLTGIPDGGDPDGFGTATLMIDDVANTITWEITVGNILLPPIGAHIHQGAVGTNGPIRIDFNAQLSGTNLADPDLVTLLGNPTGFYVNVHNEQFSSGAIRGQLGAPVPAPSAVLLFGTALAAGVTRLRRRRH